MVIEVNAGQLGVDMSSESIMDIAAEGKCNWCHVQLVADVGWKCAGR